MSTTQKRLGLATSLATMTRAQHVAEARRVSSWPRREHIARLAVSWITQFKKEGETVSSFHRFVKPSEALSTWVGWVREFQDRGDLPEAITKRAESPSFMRRAAQKYRKEVKSAIKRGAANPKSKAAGRIIAAINSGELAGYRRFAEASSGVSWLASSPRILDKVPLAKLERLRDRLQSALGCVDLAIEKAESKARRA